MVMGIVRKLAICFDLVEIVVVSAATWMLLLLVPKHVVALDELD